jgi:branched-chain amino acid transport system substrate-binding protein
MKGPWKLVLGILASAIVMWFSRQREYRADAGARVRCRQREAEAFEGILGGTSYYWGMEDRVPSAKAFNDKFRKAYNGIVPSDYGALGYAGILSVLQAVKNAKSTDTPRVIAAMEQLKYDWYKGPQFYRKCDHQSVQSVIVIESKSKNMKDKYDVFNVLAIDGPDEKTLRSCEELGHKA